MKKMLKENKGFSLVELLIALLIMAVIAGTAITMFGGVLDSSKVGADRETAEAIKRAILTYMNATNDVDFTYIDHAPSKTAQDFVDALAAKITIPDTATNNDLPGTYGPFLEKTGITPQQNNMKGWEIHIISDTQVITVKPTSTENGILEIKDTEGS